MDSIKISCVGDLLPADTAYTLGNGIGSNMARLIEYYSKTDNNPFLNSDLVFCNLEAPLISESSGLNLPFEGNPEVVQLLKVLDISIVSIANNHIPDHGREGFDQTITTLEESEISFIGTKEGNISKIKYFDIKSKRIAFAAFNEIPDHPDNDFIAPLLRDILFTTLNEIKKLSPDYIIYSFHWGNEYITWPSPSQTELAHELVDNGVNIILGHHPHVVQPVEKYNRGLIVYSLGNFLFDMFWSENVRNGIQVDLILKEDNSVDYQIKPFRIQSDFTPDYSVTKFTYSVLKKAEWKMSELLAGTREKYESEYLKESKKCRCEARINMKRYLLRNIFKLSSESRAFIFRKIFMKYNSLWKRN